LIIHLPNRGIRAAAVAVALATAGCASLPGIYKLPSAAVTPALDGAAPAVPSTPANTTALAPAVATIGALAPDGVYYAQDGQRHTLSEYKGKFLALVFFAHW
jgi:hypothetical protein